MKKPDISVLMSVYSEPLESILRAVESILSQTFSNFEFIIINDNPGNSETKKSLNKISKLDPRIKIFENQSNCGLGKSLNFALKVAQGDVIARMDTEDYSLPDRLSKQFSFFKKRGTVDLLFTQWIDIDEQQNIKLRQPKQADFRNIQKSFFIKSLLMHPTLLARKSVFIDNPYPEMSRPEDIVLWLKLIRKGYVFDIVEEPLYMYQVDRIKISNRFSKVKKGSANLIPHLMAEAKNYRFNIYFWIYFFRTIFEYLVSRNYLIFKLTHANAARLWNAMFGT